MSRKLLLSALLSTAMMAGFAATTFAQPSSKGSDYAECTNHGVLTPAKGRLNEMSSVLVLAMLR